MNHSLPSNPIAGSSIPTLRLPLLEYARALVKPLHDALPVPFVSLPTLMEMKKTAGRPQDLADIEQLSLVSRQHE